MYPGCLGRTLYSSTGSARHSTAGLIDKNRSLDSLCFTGLVSRHSKLSFSHTMHYLHLSVTLYTNLWFYAPIRSLHSSGRHSLQQLTSNTVTASRAFAVAALEFGTVLLSVLLPRLTCFPPSGPNSACALFFKGIMALYKFLFVFVHICYTPKYYATFWHRFDRFLQRGRIACNAARCNTYSNSVCPPVTRWYPIQTNKHRITRSSLWGSKNTLVFWYQQWLGGDDPFHLKFALKVTHPPLKCAVFDQYLLITSQP